MRNRLTDLLPPERKRALRAEYFKLLAVVALLFVAGLAAAAAVLLVPTYVYLARAASAERAQVAAIDATLASSNEAALSARLTALSNDASTLVALANAPSVTGLMGEVLAVSRPGVTLAGFTYAPEAGAQPATLAISGIAATRDALLEYQLALKASAFATGADLPVSVFAQSTNIPFTVTVTLAP